jgi:hypothetical protein
MWDDINRLRNNVAEEVIGRPKKEIVKTGSMKNAKKQLKLKMKYKRNV